MDVIVEQTPPQVGEELLQGADQLTCAGVDQAGRRKEEPIYTGGRWEIIARRLPRLDSQAGRTVVHMQPARLPHRTRPPQERLERTRSAF